MQALLAQQLGFALGRLPERHLPRRAHRAGHDAIDANAESAKVTRKAAREALDAGLGRHVDGEVRLGKVPRDGPKVQDHAAPQLLHAGQHGLRAEELMAQVHLDAVVPIGLGHGSDLMAVIIRGVVDQHFDGAGVGLNVRERGVQRIDIPQVAVAEDRRMHALAKRRRQRF